MFYLTFWIFFLVFCGCWVSLITYIWNRKHDKVLFFKLSQNILFSFMSSRSCYQCKKVSTKMISKNLWFKRCNLKDGNSFVKANRTLLICTLSNDSLYVWISFDKYCNYFKNGYLTSYNCMVFSDETLCVFSYSRGCFLGI